jgi:hypothetical protein
VSTPVAARWFRHAGGMSPISLAASSGRYLSCAEREEIAILRGQDVGVREIARRVGREVPPDRRGIDNEDRDAREAEEVRPGVP